MLIVSPCLFANREYVRSSDRWRMLCSWSLVFLLIDRMSFRGIETKERAHHASSSCAHRLYVILSDRCGKITWGLLLVLHMQEVCLCYLVRWRQSMSIPFSQRVRDLVESMQNRVLMGSPHFSPTDCTWSCWLDVELCADGISPFFRHREYVISFHQCKIVCW